MTTSAQFDDLAPRQAPIAVAGTPQIELTGWVVDQADLIRPEIEQSLTRQLVQLEREVGPQFVVVTVNSLGGQPIEEYGQRLGNCWGLGSGNHDDGLLLIVAPNERRARIEVGLGLEAVLTNEYTADVMAHKILPQFRTGQMESGIVRGAETLIQKLKISKVRIYAQPPVDRQGLTCND